MKKHTTTIKKAIAGFILLMLLLMATCVGGVTYIGKKVYDNRVELSRQTGKTMSAMKNGFVEGYKDER